MLFAYMRSDDQRERESPDLRRIMDWSHAQNDTALGPRNSMVSSRKTWSQPILDSRSYCVSALVWNLGRLDLGVEGHCTLFRQCCWDLLGEFHLWFPWIIVVLDSISSWLILSCIVFFVKLGWVLLFVLCHLVSFSSRSWCSNLFES